METMLTNFLLTYNGVTQKSLSRLGLSRFLAHDTPFAALARAADGSAVLHIRLDRQTICELSARYADCIKPSHFYDPRFWIETPLHDGLTDSVIKHALVRAYIRVINALSPLSRTAELQAEPVSYKK
ncbi:MAG: hypothetical protein FWH03_05270 [Firmicutes bacterium]|nr:hypothetical protein [Bacillota bacterium]